MKCKFCNSTVIRTLRKIKSPHNENNYTLYKCNDCKSSFFDFREYNYKPMNLYNNLADKFIHSDNFIESLYWKNEVKIIKSLKYNIANVLDIGCRTGDFLMHWDEKINKYGVELSSKNAIIAKKRGLHVYEDFIENIDFHNLKFDVISCYAILEHLEDPNSVLNKLSNLVSKYGILVVLVPYFNSIKSQILYLINYRWHMFSPPEHLNFFSKFFLDSFLSSKGFRLVEYKYTSGGMFNPFRKIPIIRGIFGRTINFIDFYTPLNKLPIFDHMYLYYKKIK